MSRNDGLDPEEFYRTNDMAQATYLKLQGHSVQRVAWADDSCYWYYRITDAMLDDLEDFSEGKALVEPREYNRFFNRVKREFYEVKDSRLQRQVS